MQFEGAQYFNFITCDEFKALEKKSLCSVVNKNTCLQVVQHYFASLAIPFKKKHFFLNGIDVFV